MTHPLRSRSLPPRRPLPASVSILLCVLSCVAPATLLLLLLAVDGEIPPHVVGALALASIVWTIAVSLIVRAKLLSRVRALSNVVEAARARDFSIKAAQAGESGDVGELYHQLNALVGDIEAGRRSEEESRALLERIIGQIGVAIIACDDDDRIRLVNPLAARLLDQRASQLVGLEFSRTPLADLPLGAEPRIIDRRFPGAEGRWQLSQQFYRHHGRPSRIVFIVDLRLALAEQEVAVWQKLIRVVSHEVHNSLTPIISLCQSLATIVARGQAAEQTDLMQESLGVIAERSTGLKQFIAAYTRVARLPEPQKVVFAAAALVDRVLAMFDRNAVERVGEVANATLFGDPVQLEQALINLLKNALEANATSTTPVSFSCRVSDNRCVFEIADNGAGVRNPGNLFVPFYTTKPGGAGVGLVLCRTIVGRHHGEVALENRSGRPGAVARVILPLSRE